MADFPRAKKPAAGTSNAEQATLYRMVMEEHVCPFGLKARDLLKREGYAVDDHWLTFHAETEAFKAKHNVETTPQVCLSRASESVATTR